MLILLNSEEGTAMGNPQAVRYEKVAELYPDLRGDGYIPLVARLDSGRLVFLCSESTMDKIVDRMRALERAYGAGENVVDLRGTITTKGG